MTEKAVGDVSKEKRRWASVRQVAEKRLAGLGGKLVASPHAYEIARWESPALTLIFYQHRTSAGNYHARVRAGLCTDRKLLRRAIFALAENSCQFSFPTEQKWHDEAVRLSLDEGRPYTHAG